MTTPTSSTTPTPTSPTDNAPTPTSTTAPTSPKPTSPTTPNAGTKIPTNLTQDDIVIALMGITGSGKSTFISLLADDFVRVGHELSSCTYCPAPEETKGIHASILLVWCWYWWWLGIE